MDAGFLFFPNLTHSNSLLVRGRKEKIPLLTKPACAGREGLGEVRARAETEKNVLE